MNTEKQSLKLPCDGNLFPAGNMNDTRLNPTDKNLKDFFDESSLEKI